MSICGCGRLKRWYSVAKQFEQKIALWFAAFGRIYNEIEGVPYGTTGGCTATKQRFAVRRSSVASKQAKTLPVISIEEAEQRVAVLEGIKVVRQLASIQLPGRRCRDCLVVKRSGTPRFAARTNSKTSLSCWTANFSLRHKPSTKSPT